MHNYNIRNSLFPYFLRIYKLTSMLVAALLAIYIIVLYVKESTCKYKLSPSGTERQKRINSKVLYVVSWALHVGQNPAGCHTS